MSIIANDTIQVTCQGHVQYTVRFSQVGLGRSGWQLANAVNQGLAQSVFSGEKW